MLFKDPRKGKIQSNFLTAMVGINYGKISKRPFEKS